MEVETNETSKTAKELVDEKILHYKKKKNIELYKTYRVLAYDLLFYYAIEYLYLTVEKGVSAAQVLQLNASYIFFKFLTQIPLTLLISRIGKRNSIIIANFLNVGSILLIILAPSFGFLILAQLLSAISYTVKGTCETDMLYDSIEKGEHRGSVFAKIDGKCLSRHYYVEAISAVLSGFLFVLNHHAPMIITLIVLFVVSVIAVKFEDVENKSKKEPTISGEIRNLKRSIKNIFASRRLTSLLLFNSLMVSMLKILQSMRNAVLIEVDMPEEYFGLIFAFLGIVSGISARNQNRIHKRYRNKTLTFLGLPTAMSILLLGLLLLFDIPHQIIVPIIFMIFIIQYTVKGPYFVLIKRYFNNFTTSEKRVKIATVNNLIENVIAACLVFASSLVLENLPVNYTLIIVGCIAVMLVVMLLDRMRFTVGFKMEEYGNKEIL